MSSIYYVSDIYKYEKFMIRHISIILDRYQNTQDNADYRDIIFNIDIPRGSVICIIYGGWEDSRRQVGTEKT